MCIPKKVQALFLLTGKKHKRYLQTYKQFRHMLAVVYAIGGEGWLGIPHGESIKCFISNNIYNNIYSI